MQFIFYSIELGSNHEIDSGISYVSQIREQMGKNKQYAKDKLKKIKSNPHMMTKLNHRLLVQQSCP